jgi:hypothetical protein
MNTFQMYVALLKHGPHGKTICCWHTHINIDVRNDNIDLCSDNIDLTKSKVHVYLFYLIDHGIATEVLRSPYVFFYFYSFNAVFDEFEIAIENCVDLY